MLYINLYKIKEAGNSHDKMFFFYYLHKQYQKVLKHILKKNYENI